MANDRFPSKQNGAKKRGVQFRTVLVVEGKLGLAQHKDSAQAKLGHYLRMRFSVGQAEARAPRTAKDLKKAQSER